MWKLWEIGEVSLNDEQINRYISDVYDEETKEFRNKLPTLDKTSQPFPSISNNVASLLQLLVDMIHAESILEIGTSIGFSTIFLALATRTYGGAVTTVELDSETAAKARNNFSKIGVTDIVKQLIGDAEVIVPQLTRTFDFIFLDVDKSLYPKLFQPCVRLLRSGGLLVADDTLFPVLELDPEWHHLVQPIDEFNHMFAGSKELESVILPLGDGVTIALKK
ncbi:O-methyltransferase [Coprothermobacter platensis]|uniref:O-methyltransferase n=1 Tax=Coprothermobacter platensis TaxID=108819 RepID=UPI0003737D0F|nr:O-methyltransferase [Coprothermobacter platensis]